MNDDAQPARTFTRHWLFSKGSWRLFRNWFGCAWPLWLLLGGIVVALILARLCPVEWPVRFRIAGVLLQFAGLVLIIRGFSNLRAAFEHGGYLTAIWKSLRQLGRVFYRRTKHVSGGGTFNVPISANFKGQLTDANATLEHRIEVLEKGLAELHKKQREAQRAMNKRLDELAQQSERSHREINIKVEDLHLGGLTLELVAVLWLMAGMVLATLPDYAAALLGLAG